MAVGFWAGLLPHPVTGSRVGCGILGCGTGRGAELGSSLLSMAVLLLQVKENNYRGHGDSVDQLCWHPSNPDLFVTASGDKTIRIWDVRTTKCIATVNTKGESLSSREGCWIPAGPQLRGTCVQWCSALDHSCGYW